MAYDDSKIGTAVKYTDHRGVQHDALVTNWWGGEGNPTPAINLVYVSTDETQTDPFGRQIARDSSVVHKSNQSAHGNFWE